MNIFDRKKAIDRKIAELNNSAAQLTGKKNALLDQLEKLMGHRDPEKALEELNGYIQDKENMETRLGTLLDQIEGLINE